MLKEILTSVINYKSVSVSKTVFLFAYIPLLFVVRLFQIRSSSFPVFSDIEKSFGEISCVSEGEFSVF
jgi:hypothetical protein